MAEPDLKSWYALRARNVHEMVSAHDILRQHGVQFRHGGDREEQISCPFHGKDEHPSARIYPTTPQSPSHVWCFVCRERWDCITIWKKYAGGEGKSFHRILSEIEKQFRITVPDIPKGSFELKIDDGQKAKLEFERYTEVVEQRLVSVRQDYVKLQDMQGFLRAGSVLDRLIHQTSVGHVEYSKGLVLLRLLVAKIGERVRSVPISQSPDS